MVSPTQIKSQTQIWQDSLGGQILHQAPQTTIGSSWKEDSRHGVVVVFAAPPRSHGAFVDWRVLATAAAWLAVRIAVVFAGAANPRNGSLSSSLLPGAGFPWPGRDAAADREQPSWDGCEQSCWDDPGVDIDGGCRRNRLHCCCGS